MKAIKEVTRQKDYECSMVQETCQGLDLCSVCFGHANDVLHEGRYHARFVGSNKQASNFALTSQPRITFYSDRQPYVFSSFKETKLSGCRGSSEDAGQPKRCRARRSTSMMRLCDKERGLTLSRSSV